jgi:hypothetical protein
VSGDKATTKASEEARRQAAREIDEEMHQRAVANDRAFGEAIEHWKHDQERHASEPTG